MIVEKPPSEQFGGSNSRFDKRGEKSPSLRTIVNLATVLEQKPSEMLKRSGF
jgi:hypothetical protein